MFMTGYLCANIMDIKLKCAVLIVFMDVTVSCLHSSQVSLIGFSLPTAPKVGKRSCQSLPLGSGFYQELAMNRKGFQLPVIHTTLGLSLPLSLPPNLSPTPTHPVLVTSLPISCIVVII